MAWFKCMCCCIFLFLKYPGKHEKESRMVIPQDQFLNNHENEETVRCIDEEIVRCIDKDVIHAWLEEVSEESAKASDLLPAVPEKIAWSYRDEQVASCYVFNPFIQQSPRSQANSLPKFRILSRSPGKKT